MKDFLKYEGKMIEIVFHITILDMSLGAFCITVLLIIDATQEEATINALVKLWAQFTRPMLGPASSLILCFNKWLHWMHQKSTNDMKFDLSDGFLSLISNELKLCGSNLV